MESLGLVISPLDSDMQGQIAKGGVGLAISRQHLPSRCEGKNWRREQHDSNSKVMGIEKQMSEQKAKGYSLSRAQMLL
jgi:hypothetical protein